MVGKVLDIFEFITPDQLAMEISERYQSWQTARQGSLDRWRELRDYIFATDTTTTTNNKLPWKNKTTVPKLCQIRDNLHANYMATLFPKSKWFFWRGDSDDDVSKEKKQVIESYIMDKIRKSDFETIMDQLVYDFIDYGNCFATVVHEDSRINVEEFDEKAGYVGPKVVRISPMDIVFNPLSEDFLKSPKIIRSIMTIGELKKKSREPGYEYLEEAYKYVSDYRRQFHTYSADQFALNEALQVDGFGNFVDYVKSDYVELLYFYGDLYNGEDGSLRENYEIVIVDRHKVIKDEQNDTRFGYPLIFHAGWRPRPDNKWAMGPLENLVGMQYRIDHLENLKADVFDLIAFPPIKVKGYVEDFEWGPFTKIFCGDDGDVEVMSPETAALNADLQISVLEQRMEELAGAPKEAMGFRTPGEKTKYEIQRLENASSRIFQNKVARFEKQLVEKILNAMLEVGQRFMGTDQILMFDDETQAELFMTLTPKDVTGNGKLVPIAARNFAEKAQMVQDISGFFNSAIGMDEMVKNHFSSIKLARMAEEILDIGQYNLVEENIRLIEQGEMQKTMATIQEEAQAAVAEPAGMVEGDDEL